MARISRQVRNTSKTFFIRQSQCGSKSKQRAAIAGQLMQSPDREVAAAIEAAWSAEIHARLYRESETR